MKNISIYINASLTDGFDWEIKNASSNGTPDKVIGISGVEYPSNPFIGWYTIIINGVRL